jgi:hypothetical protein
MIYTTQKVRERERESEKTRPTTIFVALTGREGLVSDGDLLEFST